MSDAKLRFETIALRRELPSDHHELSSDHHELSPVTSPNVVAYGDLDRVHHEL